MLPEKMKAAMMMGVGDVQIADTDTPKIVDPTDAIVRVTLTTICTSDVHVLTGKTIPFMYPFIMGHEFCGEVVELGSEVKDFNVGDRCLVMPAYYCGECDACKTKSYSICKNGGCLGMCFGPAGCFAEYARVQFADRMLVKIPEGLTEKDVILDCDVLTTGRFGMENGGVKEGDVVAQYGVGPIGMSACIMAKKAFRAKTVIAIDVDQSRLQTCLDHGIVDYIINSAEEDVAAKVMEITGGAGVDVAVDSVGIEATINQAMDITHAGGTISSFAVVAGPLKLDWYKVQTKNLTLKGGTQFFEGRDEIMQMIENGELDVNWMITHSSPLNDIAKAFDVFGRHEDGCIKYVLTPYDHSRD